MKKLAFALSLLFILGLLAACGGDEVADDPNMSEEAKTIVEELGGPFSAAEFDKFLADLPNIPGLTSESMQDLGDATGAALSAKVMQAAAAQGWEEERFMYIYSHVMTMVSADQMDKMTEQVKAQMDGMPEEQKKMMEQMLGNQVTGQMEAFQAELDQQIPSSEQEIIKDRMADIYKALGI